jgi:hypothetical protein
VHHELVVVLQRSVANALLAQNLTSTGQLLCIGSDAGAIAVFQGRICKIVWLQARNPFLTIFCIFVHSSLDEKRKSLLFTHEANQ